MTYCVVPASDPESLLPGNQLVSSEPMARGQMVLHWFHGRVGRCLTWDVTCPDTLAVSHRTLTSVAPGAAAERAALLKHTKYAAIKATHEFVPVVIETLGPISDEGTSFLREIGGRIKTASGDPRESAFLFQRVSVLVQRANAIALHGTFVTEESDD